jgi:hypothetical protein
MACAAMNRVQVAFPANQVMVPVISSTASSVSRRLIAAASERSNAARYRSRTRRAAASVGSARSASLRSADSMRARARCKRLFTAATDISKTSAASDAGRPRVSQRISAAR